MLHRKSLRTQGSVHRNQKDAFWRVVGVLLLSEFCVLSSEWVVQAATPDQDFAARCAAPGVLNCQGFDDPAIFSTVVSEGALTDGFGSASHPNLTRDATVFLSGGSSANFFIPAGAGDNDTGNWWEFFGQGPNNKVFGQNTTFYVQYAFRADSTWTSTDWTQFGAPGGNTAPKLSIFHNVIAGSCAEEEITVHNHNAKDLPTIYTECGGRQAITQIDGMTYSEGGPGGLFFQQGWTQTPPGYQCEYNNGNFSGPNCFHFAPNQWYTLYFKIHIGTWGSANSSIEAWVAPYGQPMLKWINTFNYIMQTESLCNASGTGQGNLPCPGYNVLELTQFMTGKIAGTGPAAHVWYDELIVSQNPIAAPGGTPPPPPPTFSPCDVNKDGAVDVRDVQLEVNMALGISSCANPSKTCTVVSVQRVVNAALGGTCVTP